MGEALKQKQRAFFCVGRFPFRDTPAGDKLANLNRSARGLTAQQFSNQNDSVLKVGKNDSLVFGLGRSNTGWGFKNTSKQNCST